MLLEEQKLYDAERSKAAELEKAKGAVEQATMGMASEALSTIASWNDRGVMMKPLTMLWKMLQYIQAESQLALLTNEGNNPNHGQGIPAPVGIRRGTPLALEFNDQNSGEPVAQRDIPEQEAELASTGPGISVAPRSRMASTR